MKPVYQEPGDGACVRACIASLFELPTQEVPTFGCEFPLDTNYNEEGEHLAVVQDRHYREFLTKYGLRHRILGYEGTNPHHLAEGLCIVSGPSPRGPYGHVCIYDFDEFDENLQRYGVLVHDPHPSGVGLESENYAVQFVAIDPAKMQPRKDSVMVLSYARVGGK